jgi:hypothetical protein
MISIVPMADSAAQSLDIPAMSGGPTYRLEVIAKIATYVSWMSFWELLKILATLTEPISI